MVKNPEDDIWEARERLSALRAAHAASTALILGIALTSAPVPANCRNCGAPPTAGRDVCTYCDTPHGVVRRAPTHDRTTPRRTLD